MAIDDAPSDIIIGQIEEEIATDSYLPVQLLRMGFATAIVSTLTGLLGGVAEILSSLLKTSPARFQRRFVTVLEEFSAQMKRIEDKIPDRRYYLSEEFQSWLRLVIEKLHATRDEAKLRAFGDALANSGSGEFPDEEEKEEFIHILRDMSIRDLRILKDKRLTGWTPHINPIEYDVEVLRSLSRLTGMGLVLENLQGGPMFMGATPPPKRAYAVSPFGDRFLKFIGDRTKQEPAKPDGPGDSRT
jgi:hypothetical protein